MPRLSLTSKLVDNAPLPRDRKSVECSFAVPSPSSDNLCRTRAGCLMEDETQVRVLAEAILKEAGHQTLSAANVAEALALVRAYKPHQHFVCRHHVGGDLPLPEWTSHNKP